MLVKFIKLLDIKLNLLNLLIIFQIFIKVKQFGHFIVITFL